MKPNITQILLPIIAGMAYAVSCSAEHDSVVSDPVTGEVVRFDVENGTRATITSDANLSKKPFMVYGEMKSSNDKKSVLMKMFDGDVVTYNDEGEWDYDIPQYWLMGQLHSFVAVHPDRAKFDGFTNLKYSPDESKLSFTYEIPKEKNKTLDYNVATDIIVAAHRRKYNFDTPGPVKFKFKHILSRINIMPALKEILMYEDEKDKINRPENKDEFIVFDSIKICCNMITKADFSFTPEEISDNENETYDLVKTYELDNSSIVEEANLTFSTPKIVTNNGNHVNICDESDALILFPQTLHNVTIYLYYRVNDDTPVRRIKMELYELNLEAGKSYTYKFIIDKAYTGQIKSGSLVIEADDFRLPEDNDNEWIDGGGTISYEFSEDGTKIE